MYPLLEQLEMTDLEMRFEIWLLVNMVSIQKNLEVA